MFRPLRSRARNNRRFAGAHDSPGQNKTRKIDSLVSARACFQIVDVLARIRRVADDQQTIRSSDFLESLNHKMRIVLRFETRDIEHISIWLNSPVSHGSTIRPAFNFRAVGDHPRFSVVTSQVVILNHLGVGDRFVWQNCRQAFGEQVVTLPSQLHFFRCAQGRQR